jgi:hypothetical protein
MVVGLRALTAVQGEISGRVTISARMAQNAITVHAASGKKPMVPRHIGSGSRFTSASKRLALISLSQFVSPAVKD